MVSWITREDLFDPTHPYADIAAARASGILYNLTGEKFQGIHTTKEVISKPIMPTGSYAPELVGGKMYNLPVRNERGMRFTDPSCQVREMRLRHTPVRQVFSVYADGREIPRDSFTIRNRAYLVKNGRVGFWDFCSTNEFTVHYEYGANPPIAGIEAAITLANEFLLQVNGDDRCKLPERVTSVTRQGVTVRVSETQDYLDNGKIGIYSVDQFIKAYNPSKAKKKAKVFKPGAPLQERVD